MFAAIGDGTYKLFLVLHLLAVIIGAGAAFTVPLLGSLVRRADTRSQAAIHEAQAAAARMVVAPALLLAGLFGVVLVLSSEGAIGFGDAWISAAFGLWVVALALVAGVVAPGEMRLTRLHRRAAGGEDTTSQIEAVRRLLSPAQGLTHLVLVVLVILMVWQPGR